MKGIFDFCPCDLCDELAPNVNDLLKYLHSTTMGAVDPTVIPNTVLVLVRALVTELRDTDTHPEMAAESLMHLATKAALAMKYPEMLEAARAELTAARKTKPRIAEA